ncbi:hypothetical protein AHMF7605_01840 [Adhaeribacter arboris]|uniref:Uncharacterized protein n=1 Tax=Adhaeribacter arboris TaxID=2072846 RepID=A0A2T2Y9Z6_9BACT|nr:hypothetical protein AHMF7605_01840 [Adhaeribacter arboris]
MVPVYFNLVNFTFIVQVKNKARSAIKPLALIGSTRKIFGRSTLINTEQRTESSSETKASIVLLKLGEAIKLQTSKIFSEFFDFTATIFS